MSTGEHKTVKVAIELADGGYSERMEKIAILARHDKLLGDGLQGRRLINALLGDDWAAPPKRVTLSYYSVDGKPQEIVLVA